MTRRFSSLFMLIGAAALILGGCQGNETAGKYKHLEPIPDKMLALMKDKGMTRRDPILIRIYKEESELELWKKKADGRYGHLKTYEICRWSGTLGPKKVEGDGQSPEGFYSVTPGQMNPNSAYYLSFNLGFPNAYDRSLGRTGKHLMVHGDCLSKGCYAMTDKQIAEVYAIAREALNAGQPAFQVQAFPFRMTAANMARRRNDPNFEFWQNLKEGSDHFEVTKLEPKVDVCGRKYVFNAEPQGSRFDPNAACPSYEVNPLIATAVDSKERRDTAEFERLVSGGLQTVAAYIPQNGRVRRKLGDPINEPQPAAVMVAEAPKPQGGFALAMADAGNAGAGVPMPVPSPYRSATARSGKPGGMFAWMRGDEPASATTPSAASPETTVAIANARRPAPHQSSPIAASLAPVPKEKPFYKRLWGFGAKEEAPAPVPPPRTATAPSAVPVPKPAPRPAAAPKPQAAAPQPASRPVSAPAPEPAPVQTAEPAPQPEPPPQPAPAPSRADAAFGAFGAPIVQPGDFR